MPDSGHSSIRQIDLLPHRTHGRFAARRARLGLRVISIDENGEGAGVRLRKGGAPGRLDVRALGLSVSPRKLLLRQQRTASRQI